MHLNRIHALALSITAALLPVASQAQDTGAWPNRAIRVVVPYAPGNTGDITFRQIQPLLESRLGARFLIDNKSGASGNIGAEEVVRARPDGHTLLLGATNNYVTNQHLIRGMRFDPLSDPIGRGGCRVARGKRSAQSVRTGRQSHPAVRIRIAGNRHATASGRRAVSPTGRR